MSSKIKTGLMVLIALIAVAIAADYIKNANIPVLEPHGLVGRQEKHLIIEAGLLALIVVVPVYVMAISIAWKYRESNQTARYTPDWDHNRLIEGLWWGIPGIIILVLSVITWNSAHSLDPSKALSSDSQQLSVQVVSLDWKWLFIYPGQNVASVNFVEFPANVALNFEITSDTVMNSLWIPALGGQIYSMPGMSTQLHLMADSPGTFRGLSANISGQGFAGMDFTAKAVSASQFNQWIKDNQRSTHHLTQAAYEKLASPSQNNPTTYYSQPASGLYDNIIAKYIGRPLIPGGGGHG